jgi:hypothetical protein
MPEKEDIAIFITAPFVLLVLGRLLAMTAATTFGL